MNFDYLLLYDFGPDNPVLAIMLRVVVSACFGTLVGFERRHKGQPAGMRTFTMVCLSSTLLTVFSSYEAEFRNLNNTIRLDPTRMAQGIMTGIGFLGAGLLIKESFTIRGITTASIIWMTSAMGILIGSGLLGVALLGAILIFFILYFSGYIESYMKFKNYMNLVIVAEWKPELDVKNICIEHINKVGLKISKLNETIYTNKKKHNISIYTWSYRAEDFEELKKTLPNLEFIKYLDFQYKNN